MLFYETKTAEHGLATKIVESAGGDRRDISWPLPNMKSATESEFWSWRSTYTFAAEVWCSHRQIEVDGLPESADVMLYWVDHSKFIGGGFAVAIIREYRKERVLYYTWTACDHNFVHRSAGNCLHRYTCENCGKSYEIDSSG